ncbi:hypothetical protein D3C75_1043080 [compost metagenome]
MRQVFVHCANQQACLVIQKIGQIHAVPFRVLIAVGVFHRSGMQKRADGNVPECLVAIFEHEPVKKRTACAAVAVTKWVFVSNH